MFTISSTYFLISFYSIFIGCILFLLFFVSYIISKQNPNLEKLSAYECGYEAFNDTQQQQDIRYFIIGLLFIIFDIELMFLFPWILIVNFPGTLAFWVGIDFLIELGLSFLLPWILFIYDWK